MNDVRVLTITKSVVSFRSKFGAMALCTVLWCMIEVFSGGLTKYTCAYICVCLHAEGLPQVIHCMICISFYFTHLGVPISSVQTAQSVSLHRTNYTMGQTHRKGMITNPFRIVFAHGHRMPISRSSKGSIHKDSSRNTCKEIKPLVRTCMYCNQSHSNLFGGDRGGAFKTSAKFACWQTTETLHLLKDLGLGFGQRSKTLRSMKTLGWRFACKLLTTCPNITTAQYFMVIYSDVLDI